MILQAQLLALALATAPAPDAAPASPGSTHGAIGAAADAIPPVQDVNAALTAQVLELQDDAALASAALDRATLEVPAWQRVRSRARILEVTSVGILLVGGVTWTIGQIQLDALKLDRPSPERDAQEGLAYSLNVGGIGFLVAGAALWFISSEIGNWAPDLPVDAAIMPTDGGANLSVGLRFP